MKGTLSGFGPVMTGVTSLSVMVALQTTMDMIPTAAISTSNSDVGSVKKVGESMDSDFLCKPDQQRNSPGRR